MIINGNYINQKYVVGISSVQHNKNPGLTINDVRVSAWFNIYLQGGQTIEILRSYTVAYNDSERKCKKLIQEVTDMQNEAIVKTGII